MPEDEIIQLHAIVYGSVQGVNFRQYTIEEAHRLEVVGWVQNIPHSRVEVVAEGTRPQLEALLTFLHRGSPHARVSKVEAEWRPATHEFSMFALRYSQ